MACKPFSNSVIQRQRWQDTVTFSFWAVTSGLGLTLLLLIAGRLFPLAFPLALLAGGIILTGAILGGALLYAWLRPHQNSLIARRLDHLLHLDERLTTALELGANNGKISQTIVQNQLSDTVAHLQGFEASQHFPLPFSWRGLMTVNLLMLGLAASLIAPNPQVPILQQWFQQQQVIADQIEQLEEIRADLLQDEALLATPQGDEAIQTLDELLDSLQDNSLSSEEMLAEISEAEQTLAGLQNENSAKEKTLNEVAESLSQFASTSDLAEAIEQRDLARAQEFLQSASETAAADPAAAETMAEALAQAAEAAAETGDQELAESLQQAAEALQQSAESQAGQNGQAAQEALEQAAEALAEAQQQLGNQESLQEALGNIQEAREQLAEAGQSGEGGEGGQSPEGQELSSGEGQGGSGGSGQMPFEEGGSGRGEPGDAPGDLFADRPNDLAAETDNGPNEGRLGEFDSQYPSIHWGGEGGPIVNPDQQGATGGIPIGEAPVNPDQAPNPSQIPYDQVYGQYSEAASEALDDNYIPLGMKEYVRDYFGALEPGSK